MVYAIVCVITLIAIGAVLAHFMIWEEDIAAILSVIFMIMVFAPLVNWCVGVTETEVYEEVVYEITGLELHSSTEQYVEGAFILGTGVVHGGSSAELQYVYFANTQYGKKLVVLKESNVYIRETDEETPKLIAIKKKKYKKANWLDKLWDSSQDIIEFGTIEEGKILVVPTNTIKIDYNVEV